MSSLKKLISETINQAIVTSLGEEFQGVNPLLQLASREEFGDFQANFAMQLAKNLKQNPRAVAEKVAIELKKSPYFTKVDIAGPGFINLTLSEKLLCDQLIKLIGDPRLGVALTAHPEKVIIDYSSANVAKEMHVGHLRSTVIGDAISRLLSFHGDEVIAQNHLGDWGTQFGMLIEYILETDYQFDQSQKIGDLNQLYKLAKIRFDSDPEFADKSREAVVALQSGNPEILQIWQQLVTHSLQHFHKIYDELDVLLTPEDVAGESFYNPMLANVVAELKEKGLVTHSEGAEVIFLPGFVDREGNSLPMILQKSGGGYLYSTTDMAAIKYRLNALEGKRLIYVVDARQSQHFSMVFAAAKAANWLGEDVKLEHAAFGTLLGKDKKPFKTRSGETIKLSDLITEAQKRAGEIALQKNPTLDSEQLKNIAHVIGIGALKYADLSTDKIKDVIFDWDKMLAFEGNTAPYLQNAYVRIQSIFRKGNIDWSSIPSTITLNTPQERKLAIQLLSFPDLIESVCADLGLHRLCHSLYDLASTFHGFYESCSVLNAKEKEERNSRLQLCHLTAQTLSLGLSLLGINVVEQM